MRLFPTISSADDRILSDYNEAGGPYIAQVPSGELVLVMSGVDYDNRDAWIGEALETMRQLREQ